MKAEIKKGLILLIPETKKEMAQIKKLIKTNNALCYIPESRKKYVYYRFKDLKIVVCNKP